MWERQLLRTRTSEWLIPEVTHRDILVGHVPKSSDDALAVWANNHINSHKFTAMHGVHLYDALFPGESIRAPDETRCTHISPICPYRYSYTRTGRGRLARMKRLWVDVDSVTTRLVRRFGPQVAEWCADTPNLIARLTSRWDLSLGESLPDGASSVTLRCQWPDGTPAVLKISPDRALLAEQVGMLGWFAASGRVPAVLAVDEYAGAMVLEEVVPGTPAEDMPAASLPGQWSDLLAALHGVAPPPRPPRVLRDRCEEAFARVGRRLSEPAIGARVDATVWSRAIQRCERLLDTEETTVLLHGDLHLGNVLDGGVDRGLMAIDPKACVGDPCFDAVDYVVAGAGMEGVETRCGRVAAACGLDGDRLHAWSRVIAPFAAIAHLGSGGEEPVIDELLALTR